MEEKIDLTEQEIDTLRLEFESRLKLAHDIFEEQTFRYLDEDGKWRLSQPLFDGTMVALDQLWENRKQLLTKKAKIRSAVELLLRRKNAYEVIVGRPNTAKAIIKRIELLASNIKRALR
jgi:hypothetical protein